MLEIKELQVYYGKAEALKGISMRIVAGEIVTIIGANGAGKTTTLRAISGLVKSTSSEIWLQGERIDGLSPNKIARRGIAHIPEGRRILAPMTVLENLEIGAYAIRDKKVIANKMEDVYHRFPVLKARKNQRAGSLSGGEQQMLAIGRALMSQPKLMLMDEPSLGLSPLLVEEVARVIKDINLTEVMVMLVEQNARMALSLAHRAYVMEVGTITIEGEAKELANDERIKKAYLGG